MWGNFSHLHFVADLEPEHVGRHITIGVHLDHQVEVTLSETKVCEVDEVD